MKYGIYRKPDGEQQPWTLAVDTDGQQVGIFDLPDLAVDTLGRLAAENKLPGDVDQYDVKGCNEQGVIVERVDEKEAEAAMACVGQLVESDRGLRMALATAICSRQLYSIAVNELQRQLDARREKDSSQVHPLALEGFVQIAAAEAGKPFDERATFAFIQDEMIRWLKQIIGEHEVVDQLERRKAWEESEKKRRSQPVPTGITLNHGEEPVLAHEQSLLLVGSPSAVKWLMQYVTSKALEAKQYVLRLAELGGGPEAADTNLIRIGKDVWKECAKTSKSLPVMIGRYVMDQLSRPLDLIVCDDLMLSGAGLVGSHPSVRAAEANKRFMQVCKDLGAAFIAGVPTPDVDTDSPRWDTVKAFATIRPVTTEVVDDMYRITVGRDAFRIDVPRKELDGISSRLIVPGGKR